MTTIVGIRFKDSGKTYFFDPQELELAPGESVIVETVRGLELARVAFGQREIPDDEVVGELKPVVRRAETADLERHQMLQARHDEVLARCSEKIREHDLPMSLVKAEYSFDGSRLTFYFTSEKRVDFRQLVRDLARTFKSRIELRQIGPRDEARLLGGIGPCGRLLCCATFLPEYARVSIKMAKDQELPLNPSKISGVCGRLLCCLSYEHEQYLEMRAALPRRGTWVQTPDGPGEVIGQNILRQEVIVSLASSGMHETYGLDQIVIATEQVASTARARNAEGVTPVARRPESKPRGERQLLREQIDNFDLESLAQLEDNQEINAPRERRDSRQPSQSRPTPPPPKTKEREERPAPPPPKAKEREERPNRPPNRSNKKEEPTAPAAQAGAAKLRRRRRGGKPDAG